MFGAIFDVVCQKTTWNFHLLRFWRQRISLFLVTESPVAQCLEHPNRLRRVVASNPIWGSDFPSSQWVPSAIHFIYIILCYLPHIDTIEYNNDLENHAVCRGNQHCLYYVLKLGKQHSTGVEYPSSAIQGKPSTYPPHRTLGGQKKPHQYRRRKSG